MSKKEIDEILNLFDLYSFYYRNIILKNYKEKKNDCDIREISKLKRSIDLLNSARENILTKNINVKLAIENFFLQV